MADQTPDKQALRNWFNMHLVDEILPHWLEAAVTPSGFFHVSLDRAWQRVEPAQATLVSQCRLLYDFSVGWRLTGDDHYRDAVAAGAEFLIRYFTDPEWRGWFFSVGPEGQVLDDKKDAYGHAFVIFGLAHAARALQDPKLLALARETLALVRAEFMDGYGGIVPTLSRQLVGSSNQRTQNPIMHLFEAHLAVLEAHQEPWAEDTLRAAVVGHSISSPETVAASAREIGHFVHGFLSLPGSGRLPEMYDETWTELSRDRGGRIDLGHACEWAFLLSRATEMGLGEEWLPMAEALLAHGLEVGEAPDGGLYSNEAPEGGLLRPDKGWWQQCEMLRALVHFAAWRGRDDLWPKLQRHLDFVRSEFLDPDYGGWYFTPAVGGLPPKNSAKGSVWKMDYHVVGMCEEALRVLGED